jgi:hypothetical protein
MYKPDVSLDKGDDSMKVARLVGLIFIAILAVSAVVASTASALPLFEGGAVGLKFSTVSGTSKLVGDNGAETVTCATAQSSGEITGSMEVGNVIVHYLTCTSTGATEKGCAIKSKSSPQEGLIQTNTLHGVLGLILPSGETGLLLLPHSGKVFVELLPNACTKETKVTGTVVGLISPLRVKQTTGLLTFPAAPIREIDILPGLKEAELVAYTSTASYEQTNEITWDGPVEVT